MNEHGRVAVKLFTETGGRLALACGLVCQSPGEWEEWLHKENVSVNSWLLLFVVVVFCKVNIDTE